jgi:hypothetical protein
MPGNWDPAVYRDRSRQWREAAETLPPSETRDAYVQIAVDYARLADLIEISGGPLMGTREGE